MADAVKATPVELKAGARKVIRCKVYEDKAKGRLLNEAKCDVENPKRKIFTNEAGDRFVSKGYVFPYPAGLLADTDAENGNAPVPAKPNMSAAEIAQSISDWVTTVEQIKAAGGLVTFVGFDDTTKKPVRKTLTIPIEMMPTIAEMIEKGISLKVQGPMNLQMQSDYLIVTGEKSKKATEAKGGSQTSLDVG